MTLTPSSLSRVYHQITSPCRHHYVELEGLQPLSKWAANCHWIYLGVYGVTKQRISATGHLSICDLRITANRFVLSFLLSAHRLLFSFKLFIAPLIFTLIFFHGKFCTIIRLNFCDILSHFITATISCLFTFHLKHKLLRYSSTRDRLHSICESALFHFWLYVIAFATGKQTRISEPYKHMRHI